MSPAKRYAQKQAKARQRRRLKAQERLARDCRQAQQAAQALEQALEDLGLPEELVAEIEGRLRSQQKLLSKICGVMFPPLFGCRTNTELCRVRGWTYSTERAIARRTLYPFAEKGLSALAGPPDHFRYLPEPVLSRRFRS